MKIANNLAAISFAFLGGSMAATFTLVVVGIPVFFTRNETIQVILIIIGLALAILSAVVTFRMAFKYMKKVAETL